MPAVVHPFVHIHAGDHGGGPLLRADEVQREQRDEAAEHQPGPAVRGAGMGCGSASGAKAISDIVCCLGISRPVEFLAMPWPGLASTRLAGVHRLQWRDRAGIPPASESTTCPNTMRVTRRGRQQRCPDPPHVIPAKAGGFHASFSAEREMDSRLRGNDTVVKGPVRLDGRDGRLPRRALRRGFPRRRGRPSPATARR